MKSESFSVGVTFTTLSAFGAALICLFGKLGMEEFSLEKLIFWRFVASTLICIFALAIMGKLHTFHLGNVWLHVLRAALVLGIQYCLYYYIVRNTLLNGLVLLSMGPLLIPFIEWTVLRQKIGKSTWIGLIISFIGMLCVLQPDAGIFSLVSLVGLLAGIFQGCSQVVFAISSRGEKPEVSTLYMLILCTIFSFFPYVLFEGTVHSSAPGSIWLIFALGLATVLNQLARGVAYQHGTASKLSTFMYFSILFGGFFDWAIFDKIPNMLSVIGAILVVLGGISKIYFRNLFMKP